MKLGILATSFGLAIALSVSGCKKTEAEQAAEKQEEAKPDKAEKKDAKKEAAQKESEPGAEKNKKAAKEKPEGYKIAGSYDSEKGVVVLTQNGHDITGTYPDGTVTGKLKANGAILFEWTAAGSSGKGKWMLSQDGQFLNGSWGTEGSRTNGGEWKLTRQ